jgi:hypothetical protein
MADYTLVCVCKCANRTSRYNSRSIVTNRSVEMPLKFNLCLRNAMDSFDLSTVGGLDVARDI